MRIGFLLFVFACTTIGFAQMRVVSGKVVNDVNEPLGFAKISSKSPKGNALTANDGFFSIQLKDTVSATLTISIYGYQTQEVVVGPGDQNLTLVMKPEFSDKKEITVIGYGEAKNKTITGATSKVDGEDIEKMNMARMDQALQGQMAGVNISTNSGSPGGSANIRIRGLGTFGDNDPLILVDGIVYDSQGLNKKLDLLHADEYAVIKNEMFAMGGQAMPFDNVNVGKGTDWQDQVFTRSPVQSHNISLNGGTLNTRYSIGLGYFNQDGIVGGAKSHFDRYNARLNFSTDLSDKLKLNSVLLFSTEGRNTLPENGIGSVLYNAINAFPTEPVISPMGNYSYMEEVSDIINPVAQIMNTYNWNQAQKFVGKEEFVYKPLSFLTVTNRFNYNVSLVDSKVFSPLVWYGDGKYANTALNDQLESPTVELTPGFEIDRGAAIYEERNTFSDLSYEGFANYDQVFKTDHQVKATAGVTIFQRDGKSLNGVAYGVPNNDVNYADISANTTQGGYLNNTGSWEFTERLVSVFMRAEYGFKEKYLVSMVVRRDGSSKFGPNSRFGTFPSMSAGWLISEEKFFKFKPIDLLS